MNVDLTERILAVARDPAVLDLIVGTALCPLETPITCAAQGAEALRLDRAEPHDVVIAELSLPDMKGLDFARDILARRHRPVILFGDHPTTGELLAAIRLGVSDVLPTPLHPHALLDAAARCMNHDAATRRQLRRQEKLRTLLRRVLRDRRCLNQRIDLICRDIVGAQRRLFHRVLSLEDRNGFVR